jgi:hypothetical protein
LQHPKLKGPVSVAHQRSAIRIGPFWTVALVIWWGLFFVGMYAIYATHPDGAGDYLAYYKAASGLVNETPIYSGIYGSKPYLYPPFFAILLTPLARLTTSYETHVDLWFITISICLVIGTWLLTHQLQSRKLRIGLWLLAPIFTPVFMAYLHGQVTVVLYLLIVAAWVSARNKQLSYAGALITVAAWIKIYPALLLGLFLLRQDWKGLRGAIIAGLGIGLFQLLIVGPDMMLTFFTSILPELGATGQTNLYHSNVAVMGFWGRFFVPSPYVTPPLLENQTLFVVLRLLTILILITGFVISVRLNRASQVDTFDLEYGLAVVTVLLITSSLAVSGLVVLILVYAVLLSAPVSALYKRRIQLWCLLGLVLSPVDTMIAASRPAEPLPLPPLALSTSFFTLVLLWVLLVMTMQHIRQRQGAKAIKQA